MKTRVGLLFLALWLAACTAGPAPAFHGAVISPAMAAPEIALVDQTGQPARLSAWRGDVVLLFFGYTSCPDACPLTMGQFKSLRARLGADATRVKFVLVTVDPAVDTPAKLAAYLAAFDPSFIGLTGTPAELAPVWQAYGVAVGDKDPTSGEIAHSTRIYAVDAQGNLRLTYAVDPTDNTNPLVPDMLDDVRLMLAEAH
jgi:protein SCO1/2